MAGTDAFLDFELIDECSIQPPTVSLDAKIAVDIANYHAALYANKPVIKMFEPTYKHTKLSSFETTYTLQSPVIKDVAKGLWEAPPKPEPLPEPEPEVLTLGPGPFQYDQHGYARHITPHLHVQKLTNTEIHERMALLSRTTNRVVARGFSSMSVDVKKTWLRAWYAGNLKRCYELETAHSAAPSPKHPGAPDNPLTHVVMWQPAVRGEIPAGATVPGDWPSPAACDTTTTCVDNYLVAARMAHPTHLTWGQRRTWVTAHLRGDKSVVDALSLAAQSAAAKDAPTWMGQPVTIAVKQPTSKEGLTATATNLWPINALSAYIAEHQLSATRFWDHRVAAVQAHRDAAEAQKAAAAQALTFTYLPVQPTLSGYHRKAVLVDQHERQWLFKPAHDDAHRFRPETEHEAHTLARLWGYPTAESRLITVDGQYGQAQRLLPVDTTLAGYTGADFTRLTVAQLCAVAKEHCLDWALDNDDTHGENILVLLDGTVVGVDKGRAWRYFGSWDGLSSNGSANSNAALIYTALYRAIKDHHLDRATVDAIYFAVIQQANRMRALPGATIREVIARAVANRPHFNPPTYQRAHPAAPTDAETLIAAAIARATNLPADMQRLWQRIYAETGWDVPDPTTAPMRDNPQGHPIFTSLTNPELHQAIAATKSYGTPCFVAGTDIEDAHILLWRERRPDGQFNIRGTAKIRGAALTTVSAWLVERATNKMPPPEQPRPSDEGYYYRTFTRVIECAHGQGIADARQYKVDLQYLKTNLESNLRHAQIALTDQDPDEDRAFWAATAEVATLYLGYATTILGHLAAGTMPPHTDAMPRWHWTPPAIPPEPNHDPTQPRIERRPATRAAVTQGKSIALPADGELQLNGSVLAAMDHGQAGSMYLITLPTGEQIEVRDATTTGTALTLQGLLQFTIPDATALTASLQRIVDQLAAMGLPLREATSTDLELFYWRHLANLFRDRADTRMASVGPYGAWWKRANSTLTLPVDEEIAMWRHAFAAITSPEQIEAFIAADGHLPRFLHMDLRQPNQPCGRPYWERFDVTDDQCAAKHMPCLSYRNGPKYVIATGAALSTEERTRVLATWKPGTSSYEDLAHGSGAFVFTRLNQGANGIVEYCCESCSSKPPSIFFNPRVMRRTSNYSFSNDQFGKIEQRRHRAKFDFDNMTKHTESANELLIKNAMTILDDIELMVFRNGADRHAAIATLTNLGITEIRGQPVTQRLIVREDLATRMKAIAAARAK